jgi:hypothetical protein
MNKSVTLLLTLAIALTLNGCDNKKSNSNDTTSSSDITCTGGGEVKHGYKLPPCPDPIENSKTLLGIDSNNNGVRDDVEIWIYNTYDTYKACRDERYTITVDGKNTVDGKPIVSNGTQVICDGESQPFHQIVREVAMQEARAFQIIIQEPEKAREKAYPVMKKSIDCYVFFKLFADVFDEQVLIPYGYDINLQNIQINTKQRVLAYLEYNKRLGGGVYDSTPLEELKSQCDFDVDALLEKQL